MTDSRITPSPAHQDDSDGPEFIRPYREEIDVQGWVSRIASVPGTSRPQPASMWKTLRLALTLSVAASAK